MERSAEPTHCGDVELGESNQSKPELGESNQSKPDLPSAQAPEAAPSAPSPGVAERKPSRQQDPSLDSQCFPRAGRAHRKMASRRKFDGLQSQSSPLQRLVIESAPWVILGAGVAVAIIIIALQPPRAPEYPSTSSPPLSTTCLQARRAAGATGEPARSCLFVLSGSRSAQFKGHETAVHSYNGSHWLEEKPLSTACHELGSRPVKPAGVGRALTAGLSATLGRRIYVIGVAGDGCFQSYDGSADWRTEEPLPEEIRREGASLITYRNALYLLGGYDRGSGETVDWVSFFVPKELKGLGTWQEGPALPTARSGMAACVAFGRLFTLGGSYTPTVESFDGSSWRAERPLHTRLSGSAAVFFEERIWIVGGFSYGRFESTVEAFNGISWKHEAKLNVARAWHSCVIWQERIACLGGTSASASSSDEELKGMSTQSSVETLRPTASSFHGASKWELSLLNLTAPLNMLGAVVFAPQEPPLPQSR